MATLQIETAKVARINAAGIPSGTANCEFSMVLHKLTNLEVFTRTRAQIAPLAYRRVQRSR